MAEASITQDQLKELLRYCPDSGVFVWKITIGPRAIAGSVAGRINHTGYAQIGIYGKRRAAHRLAYLYMTGEFPPNEIDHINGVKDDNRWCNIRAVTRTENLQNRRIHRTNTSGTMGVTWHKGNKKWRALITIDRKQILIGYFDVKEDAISARKLAEVEHNFHPNHGRK